MIVDNLKSKHLKTLRLLILDISLALPRPMCPPTSGFCRMVREEPTHEPSA
jgi:hypothetical protein